MPSSHKLQIWLKSNCTWMFIGWSSTNFTFFVPVWNSKWRLRQDLFNIGPYGENVSKHSFSETKLPRNDHWKLLYKVCVFYADRISKMATTAGHRLTLDPKGKYSNAFFSETTNIIKAKLYMNVHWMVLYKLSGFFSYTKFKMAATAGLSLTLDPKG